MNDQDKAWGCALALLALIIVVVCGVFWYLKTNTYTETGIVTALTWQRTIRIDKFTALAQDTHQSYMPADAYDVAPYTKSVPYSYTCGSSCHESCYGSGKNRTCYQSCTPKSCMGIRLESWARYVINRWIPDHTLETHGTPRTEMMWPDFTPDATEALGSQREGQRIESFYIVFKTTDGKTFTYSTPDIAAWQAYSIESRWRFQVNRLEEPQWETLKAQP